jgi:broad specificity phosphatase PhoE
MLVYTRPPAAKSPGSRVGTRLLLARHGETEWNRLGRWQGQHDLPLSSRGREQALALCARLKSERLSAVYSSALRRAIETAHEIAVCHRLNVCRDARLNELNLGEWEGLRRQEIATKYPQLLQAWEADTRSVSPPNGESVADLERRVLSAIQEIALAYPGETVCLIGHKMTNGIIRCRYLDLLLNDALQGVPEQAVAEVIEIPHPLWG